MAFRDTVSRTYRVRGLCAGNCGWCDGRRSPGIQVRHRQGLRLGRRQCARISRRGSSACSASSRFSRLRLQFGIYFVSWLGERTVADIRLAVHRNLLRLSPGFFEENRPAEITSRITVDTTIIEQVVGTTVSVALRNIVMGFGCVVTMFVLAPKLAALMLLGIPVVFGPILILGPPVRAISTRNQDRIADVGTVTTEVLGAMKIVQAFNQQQRETSRFSEAVERVFATAKRRIAAALDPDRHRSSS